MARIGHSDTASPKGGWRSSRASWLGMAAVIVLAAALFIVAAVAAERASGPDSVAGTTASQTAILDASDTPTATTSSTSSSPTPVASSWSMPPLPEEPVYVSSATDLSPITRSSSVVFAPR